MGRPPTFGETRVETRLRLPRQVIEALDKLAAARGVNRTDVVIELAVAAAGLDLKRSA